MEYTTEVTVEAAEVREDDLLDMTTVFAALDAAGAGDDIRDADRHAADAELAVVESVERAEPRGSVLISNDLLNVVVADDAEVTVRRPIAAEREVDVTRVEEAPQPGLVHYTGRVTFASGGDLERVMTMHRGDEDHMQVQAWLAGDVALEDMAAFVVALDSVDLVEDPAVGVDVFETSESPAWEVAL